MNNITLHACGASFLLLLSSSVFGAEPIRAGYEVVLTDAKDKWEASTVVPVEAGQPIKQGLGPYVVSMNVKEEKDDKYTLLVHVTGLPGSTTENSEFLRHSFAGDHKQQLEFAASEGRLGLKGVIFVGSPKSAAK